MRVVDSGWVCECVCPREENEKRRQGEGEKKKDKRRKGGWGIIGGSLEMPCLQRCLPGSAGRPREDAIVLGSSRPLAVPVPSHRARGASSRSPRPGLLPAVL